MNDCFSHLRDQQWPLSGLVAEVRTMLEQAGVRAADDRVRAFPDARTVRHYQTMGVLDRPVRYDGRTAMYGYRSLLQAVTVKLLQARGLSLAQVQASLTGTTTAALESAVAEALGSPAQAEKPGPVALRTVEVAPGVLLTIDPRVVADPDALVARIHTLLSSGGTS
jgi:DNA-binding transcriptional MerR regulator